MRSRIRSIAMITVLAAPLAALAADTAGAAHTGPQASNCSAPCSTSRDATRSRRALHDRAVTGDPLEQELGGQHGVPNSFDSP
jgi:hypothetical protein